jgi:hypothetical protein
MAIAVRSEKYVRLYLAIVLVFAAAAARLLPHPANFAPVTAVAIFGGAVLPRKLAVWVPLAAMLLSDLVIGFYDYRVMFAVWASYVLIAFASSRWLARPSFAKGALLTALSSLFFFITTNFAVWASSDMYAHTWRGLADCYIMALPFFRNTFLSDALYTAILFGTYALAREAVFRLYNPLSRKA